MGQALATAFARKGLEVSVATRRPSEALTAQARAIRTGIIPRTLRQATGSDVIILAVPYAGHRTVGSTLQRWDGKLVIDASNAFNVPPEQFHGASSSKVAAKYYPSALFVKALNHLPAEMLAVDLAVHGGRRVIFVASDDASALTSAKDLIAELVFETVSLEMLAEGGPMTEARGSSWSPITFQNFVKF